jgi:hypothetical protein
VAFVSSLLLTYGETFLTLSISFLTVRQRNWGILRASPSPNLCFCFWGRGSVSKAVILSALSVNFLLEPLDAQWAQSGMLCVKYIGQANSNPQSSMDRGIPAPSTSFTSDLKCRSG